jgi:hypothetical protein
MTKTITISGVELIKSGLTGAGTPWELWKITDENGEKYSTFDKKYCDMLGQTVEVTYEEKRVEGRKTGQFFTNRTIIEKASLAVVQGFKDGAAKAKQPQSPAVKEIMDKLDEILRILRPPL